jgi:glucan-binding YG repeat protein
MRATVVGRERWVGCGKKKNVRAKIKWEKTRVYKDGDESSHMHKRTAMHATWQEREACADKPPARVNQQRGVFRNAEEHRECTKQYEQELECTQEATRCYAMRCSGRS